MLRGEDNAVPPPPLRGSGHPAHLYHPDSALGSMPAGQMTAPEGSGNLSQPWDHKHRCPRKTTRVTQSSGHTSRTLGQGPSAPLEGRKRRAHRERAGAQGMSSTIWDCRRAHTGWPQDPPSPHMYTHPGASAPASPLEQVTGWSQRSEEGQETLTAPPPAAQGPSLCCSWTFLQRLGSY